MRKPHGYATLAGPPAPGETNPAMLDLAHNGECDTIVCNHCGRVMHVSPFDDGTGIAGRCNNCDSLICPECVRGGLCKPLIEQIDEKLRRSANLQGWI